MNVYVHTHGNVRTLSALFSSIQYYIPFGFPYSSTMSVLIVVVKIQAVAHLNHELTEEAQMKLCSPPVCCNASTDSLCCSL